jgi:23S rRNA (uracil1939-C5)-methyltransferase
VGRDASVVESTVEAWAAAQSATIGADVVIADPARRGLGREAVAALAKLAAPVMVLVSCDPVALARDAQLLSGAGYRHDATTVLDLFPQTHHVEAVTRFVRFE